MAAVLSLSLSLSIVSRRALASAPSSRAASTLTPRMSTALFTSSSPWLEASLPFRAVSSFSSSRACSSMALMRAGTSPGVTRRVPATPPSVASMPCT
ncbi:MAG: hypothetical protein BWX79_02815 [Alphaproteobacteria bacterium ADurb.Bin100]|nr:MAG: hypothetical protein BWX79_02815 [Alphaproteobacteria bacterium ADurb.Bin100]